MIYGGKEEFKIGGSKVHKVNKVSKVHKVTALIIAAGVTLHEALKAQKELEKQGVETVVLDCYSVKPLDAQSINRLVKEIKNVIVVEDHYPAGGIGEAVADLLVTNHQSLITSFTHLCVHKLPRSGTPEELLRFEEIDAEAIVNVIQKMNI